MEKRAAGERYSSPFFCAPNWDAVVAPLPGCEPAEAYEPVGCCEAACTRFLHRRHQYCV